MASEKKPQLEIRCIVGVEPGKPCTGTQLKDGVTGKVGGRMFFEVVGNSTAGIPKMMALSGISRMDMKWG